MYSVLIGGSDPHGLLLAKLMELQTTGIVEEESGWRAFFEDETAGRRIAAEYGADTFDVRPEPECSDWQLSKDCDPVEVGSRFWIAPPANREPTPSGRFRLELETHKAFGTGRHESTQLMIAAMEQVLQPGQRVVDVGCGSGILMLAAGKLGASAAIACDLDFVAASEARQRSIPVFQGSVDAIRPDCADVVLANLTTPILDGISDQLKRLPKKNGLVVISGFLSDRTPQNYLPKQTFALNSWECWICEPR